MFRVVLADDEPWVLYSLRNMVDWEREGFTIVGEAVDGLHVLEVLRLENPDVLMTDIRMPGLDGIELLRRIRDEGLHARVVFVSGYAEFQYAQQAVQLGAFDYLLKPADESVLIGTLRRLSAELGRASANDWHMPDIMFQELLFEAIEANDAKEAGAILARRGMETGVALYGAVSIQAASERCCTTVRAVLERHGARSIALHMPHLRHAHLYGAGQSVIEELRSAIVAASRNEEASVGLSEAAGESLCLQRLSTEAKIAMMGAFMLPGRNVNVYRERRIPSGIVQTMADLRIAVRQGDAAAIRSRIRQIGSICRKEDLNIREVAEVYNQASSIVCSFGNTREPVPGASYIEYNDCFRSFRDFDDMMTQLEALSDPTPQRDAVFTSDFIRGVVARIDRTFTEDLRLGTIARDLNISLGHLSNLIKRELGVTYMEYVTQKRLDEARALLRDERMSIADVAEAVGFKDYFHFIKVFKRHVGLSPTKYRKGCASATDRTAAAEVSGQAFAPEPDRKDAYDAKHRSALSRPDP